MKFTLIVIQDICHLNNITGMRRAGFPVTAEVEVLQRNTCY